MDKWLSLLLGYLGIEFLFRLWLAFVSRRPSHEEKSPPVRAMPVLLTTLVVGLLGIPPRKELMDYVGTLIFIVVIFAFNVLISMCEDWYYCNRRSQD